MPPRVICLVPARNAAADLPRLLESAASVCDAVIALDDGSTDATRELLTAHPLVARVLTNPIRTDYRNWDDAENRNRLLEAAAEFEPDWILSLDADERIDPSDAAALREFLATDALPGCAYGFHHVPMRGDPDHYVPRFQWVFRLFSYAPGQRFPHRKLHFAPVPTSIPRALWIRTTLRIQHFGSLTADRRVARFEKYLEADPDRTYQSDYRHLLYNPAPSELLRWQPRDASLPVLDAALGLDEGTGNGEQGTAETAGPDEFGLPENSRLKAHQDRDSSRGAASSTVPRSLFPVPSSDPALSAIIIARDNEATIARTVASVVGQECPEPFETIVVVSGTDRTAAIVREQFPAVTLVELPKPALPGEARNAGLRVARGEFISFPGSHVELPPGSLAARLRAHRRGYAMVTGVAENGTRTRSGWASYFLDHARGLPGHLPTVLKWPPDHCSYARDPLLEVGGFPEGVRTAEDTAVNRELVRRGYVAIRDPRIQFVHNNPCRTIQQLIPHHFRRGRGWGRMLLEDFRTEGGLLNRATVATRLVGHLPARWRRIANGVRTADANLLPHYQRCRPHLAAAMVASWLGMWVEVLRPSPGKWAILRGHPVRTLALIGNGDGATVTLVRLDIVAGTAFAVRLPTDLRLTLPDGRKISLDEATHTDPAGGSDDLRDLIGYAVDLDVDAAIIAPAETWPTRETGPSASLDLTRLSELARLNQKTTIPVALNLTELGRFARRFGTIEIQQVGTESGDSSTLAAMVRARVGLAPEPVVAKEPASPETWWP